MVPAGNPDAWESDPFTLTERDGRWYVRGAADCKGNVAMHLAALRALDAAGGTDLNLTVLIEGSEERGGEGGGHHQRGHEDAATVREAGHGRLLGRDRDPP